MPTLLTNNDIGKRMRRARIHADLTCGELGGRVGVDHSTISRWEKGERSIDAIPLLRIAYVLDQPITYFSGESPINENPKPKDAPGFRQWTAGSTIAGAQGDAGA